MLSLGASARLDGEDLWTFVEELRVALAAGLPMPDVLERLARAGPRRRRPLLSGMAKEVGGGARLSAAAHPELVPRELVTVLFAGERAGNLPDALAAYGLELEARLERARRLRATLLYPGVVLVLLLFVAVLLGAADRGPLARLTGGLSPVWTASLLVSGLLTPLLALALLATVGSALSPAAGAARRAVLALPLVGRTLREESRQRAFRTLSFLLARGSPLPEALRIAARGVPDPSLGNELLAAADRSETGAPWLEGPMGRLLSPVERLVLSLRPDDLPGILKRLADDSEWDAARGAARAELLAEIGLLLLVGVVTGLFLATCFGLYFDALGAAFPW